MAKGVMNEWLEEDKLLLLEAWARDGLTDEQIAHNIGIEARTLYRWKEKSSQISQSLKKGKEVVDIIVENALYKNAIGYYYEEQTVSTEKEVIYEDGKRVKEISKPVVITLQKYKPCDTVAQIFWLKNRKRDKWQDKIVDTENEEAITNASSILVKIRKTVDDRYDRA